MRSCVRRRRRRRGLFHPSISERVDTDKLSFQSRRRVALRAQLTHSLIVLRSGRAATSVYTCTAACWSKQRYVVVAVARHILIAH